MTPADHLAFLADAPSPLGRLRVEGELPGQRGSTGVVLPAVDDDAGTRFALKLVRGRVATDRAVLERARTDALAQTGLEHPRIARLHESGQMPGGFYLLMAWLPGRSLARILGDGPMDPWAAVAVAADVADALEAATAAGVLAGELTPDKVVVDEDGRAALGDLGAGRRRTGDPPPARALDYLSPERVRDEPVTPAAHEYALACVLFHALTGAPPFAAARGAAKAFWHLRADRPQASGRRSGLPEGLDAVLARGMAIEPGARHGGPGAFVDAVRTALGDRPQEPEAAEAPEPDRTATAPGSKTGFAVTRRPVRPAPDGGKRGRRGTGSEAAATEARIPWDEAPAEPAPPKRRKDRAAAGTAPAVDWVDEDADPNRRAVLAGGVAALLLAAAGFAGGSLLGGTAKEAPVVAGPGAVGTDRVAVVRPAGWQRLDPEPEVPGLDVAEQVAVGPSGSAGPAVVAGMGEPGADGLLPDALVEELDEPPGRGEPVRLGSLQGRRHRGLDLGGRAVTVYAVPTNSGTAIVACLDVPEATCDGEAATLQLIDSKPLPVRAPEAYAGALEDAFATLNRSRGAALDALAGARYRAGQAAAAARLASAYGAAAGTLREAPERRYAEAENAAIVRALQGASDAYRDLASAARRGAEGAYDAARRRATSAERGINRALARLDDAGYRVG